MGVQIPIASRPHGLGPHLPVNPRTQEPSTVLLVGQIGEPVNPDLVSPVRDRVMFVNEFKIILEDLEPLLFLSQCIVRFTVLHHPHLVHLPHLSLAPLRGQAVLHVVVNDGHV
uniref:Uncharacterized protein n=1 Tax=Rhizophora mucronata TaxID=61149 RepID=A0A2P2J6H7_RHIMU